MKELKFVICEPTDKKYEDYRGSWPGSLEGFLCSQHFLCAQALPSSHVACQYVSRHHEHTSPKPSSLSALVCAHPPDYILVLSFPSWKPYEIAELFDKPIAEWLVRHDVSPVIDCV